MVVLLRSKRSEWVHLLHHFILLFPLIPLIRPIAGFIKSMVTVNFKQLNINCTAFEFTYYLLIILQGTTLLSHPHLAWKDKIIFPLIRKTSVLKGSWAKKMLMIWVDLKSKLTLFSIGKISCPTEAVAQVVSFLVVVYTVKHFELCVIPDEEPPPVIFFIQGR